MGDRLYRERKLLYSGKILQNRYCIKKMIGQGGFGISYLSVDFAQDKDVVIKEYFPYGKAYRGETSQVFFKNNSGKYDMFIHEASILEKLKNIEGIVKIQDFFLENNTAYIVMGRCKGMTLREMVQKNGRMEAKESYVVMESLQKSLEQIHRHGIIHRDICPENIIVTEAKEVELIDFGSALDLNSRKQHLEEPTYRSGFSPPEQYEKGGIYGVWTDIYAFYATWYFCLANAAPPGAEERLDCDVFSCRLRTELEEKSGLMELLERGMALDYKKRNIWKGGECYGNDKRRKICFTEYA